MNAATTLMLMQQSTLPTHHHDSDSISGDSGAVTETHAYVCPPDPSPHSDSVSPLLSVLGISSGAVLLVIAIIQLYRTRKWNDFIPTLIISLLTIAAGVVLLLIIS